MEKELYKFSENNLESDLTLNDCIKIVVWLESKKAKINHKIIHQITAQIIDAWIDKKISDDEYNEIRHFLCDLKK